MKTFGNQTYYEILKISVDADAHEVKRAYHEAIELYAEGSLATYALFSDDERCEVLQVIEEAFFTLSDEIRRKEYNQKLIDSGRLTAKPVVSGNPDEIGDKSKKLEPPRHRDLNAWVKIRSKEDAVSRLIDEIMGKDLVSGTDLKRLRTALGIAHSEIYEITRISATVLNRIEENEFAELPSAVFLKSFLKSYAEILHIDSYRVVQGYLKYMLLAEK